METMNNICIYKHTSPSGKVYIGQTGLKPENRWNNGNGYEGSTLFFSAIQKYGWENIQHEVLFTGLDQLNADIIEEDLIYYYKQIGKSYNLYNSGSASRGWKQSDEAKEKISKALKGNVNGAKRVEQIDKNTLEVIKVWDSLSEAGRHLNIQVNSISVVCKGKGKTAGGYKWRYKND